MKSLLVRERATGRQAGRQQNQWRDRWSWRVRVIRQRGGWAGAGPLALRVPLTDGPFEPILHRSYSSARLQWDRSKSPLQWVGSEGHLGSPDRQRLFFPDTTDLGKNRDRKSLSVLQPWLPQRGQTSKSDVIFFFVLYESHMFIFGPRRGTFWLKAIFTATFKNTLYVHQHLKLVITTSSLLVIK